MTTQTQTNISPIRRILYANAIFSGGSGLLFTVASNPIASFIGLDSPLAILIIGIGLLGYAGLIYVNASRSQISPCFVLTAVIGDSLWVLLSILLLVTDWVSFSTAGKCAVGIVAISVDVFATLQFMQWRRMV